MKKLALTVCAFLMTVSVNSIFASTHESNEEPTQTDSIPTNSQSIIALTDTISPDTAQLMALTDDNEPAKEESGDNDGTEKKDEPAKEEEPTTSFALTDDNEPAKEEQPTEQEPTKDEPSQEENIPTGTPEKEALA